MSPMPSSRRRLISIRLSNNGLATITEMARTEEVTVSDMIRTLLSEAVQARAGRPARR